MNRVQAALTHLGISVLLLLMTLFVIFFYWYPGNSFVVEGGLKGLILVSLVDLVIGPGLTLVVFKANKPKLKLDLSIIALCQLSAMSYGLYSLHQNRPVLAVWYQQQIVFLTEAQTDFAQVSHPFPPKQAQLGLPLMWLPSPESYEARKAFRLEAARIGNGKSPVHVFGQRFLSLPHPKLTMPEGLDLATWIMDKPEQQAIFNHFKQSYSAEQLNRLVYYPIRGRFDEITAVMDKTTQQVLTTLLISPPPIINFATNTNN